jgi:SAM-dependent methyltransferase
MTMKFPINIAKKLKKKLQSALLSYPKKVECNVCGWSGSRFMSDSWHENAKCPNCYSNIRHRLFYAALQNIDNLLFDTLICNKRILHFAPEKIISSYIRHSAAQYVTVDFIRNDCDLRLDMSSMPDVGDESFDIVIAFDVLEHVPYYQNALSEVHRILTQNGIAIFTVPQKDNLSITYEDSNIKLPADRLKYFGQDDHLRIFGNDFINKVENMGFLVTSIDESFFPKEMIKRHVLFPPQLSKHPLATNYRKVYFCQKV